MNPMQPAEIKQAGRRPYRVNETKSSTDRKSENLIRAAGDGTSIDSALSINPSRSMLQTFKGSRVRSKALAVSGTTAFYGTREAKHTSLNLKSMLGDLSSRF